MLNTVREKLGSLNKKALISGFAVFVVLLALPIALFLVNQRQDTRQQAAGTGDQVKLSLTLTPSSKAITTTTPPQIEKGAQFEVKLFLDTKGRNVVNMTTQINYDQTKFTLNSIDTAGGAFSTYLPNIGTGVVPAGNARLVASVANPATPLKGSNLLVATYKFTATNNASQLGRGIMFFTTPTEIVEQNPGSTTTALLTYEFTQAEFEIVNTLPVNTGISTQPATGGAVKNITTNVYSTGRSNSSKTLSLGYKFKPLTNGTITQLWCYRRSGTVILWSNTGSKLTETAVTCPTGSWGSVNITPIPVSAQTIYTVSIASSSFYRILPFTKNTQTSGIEILGGYYDPNGTGFPTVDANSTYGIPGIPDVTFVSDGTGAGATGIPTSNPVISTAPITTGVTRAVTAAVSTGVTSVPATIPATQPPVTLPPVSSPNPNQARIDLALKLPGIGNNTANGVFNANLGENNSPRPKRTFDIYLYNAQGTQTGNSIPVEFTYSPTEGAYKGAAFFSGIPLDTVYTIKARADNSILKNIGFVDVRAGEAVSLNANNPSGELVTGKVNITTPNIIGVQDYTDFMTCFRNQPACSAAMKTKADFTDDGKIDLKDLNILLSAFANRQGD